MDQMVYACLAKHFNQLLSLASTAQAQGEMLSQT